MAKRGTKPTPTHLKAVAGTDRPDRENVLAFQALPGEVLLPDDYEDLKKHKPVVAEKVLRAWNRKMEIYRLRGQSVVGCEAALYQYCLLEVAINERYAAGAEVPQAMVNGHRVYANEFYDTPASQVIKGGAPAGNRFGNNGKPRKP